MTEEESSSEFEVYLDDEDMDGDVEVDSGTDDDDDWDVEWEEEMEPMVGPNRYCNYTLTRPRGAVGLWLSG